MKLACNYLKETVLLAQQGKIDIDYFKFPALWHQCKDVNSDDITGFVHFIEETSKIRPVLIHGIGMTLNPGARNFRQSVNIEKTKKILSLCVANGISVHIDSFDYSLTADENIKIITDNVLWLREQLPDLDFLALENNEINPYHRYEHMRIDADPELISGVVYKTGSDFLLDISHAYISAMYMKLEHMDYISRLPLDKLYEIHINGWIDTGSDIMAHTSINETEYEILSELLKKHTPKIITCEYGRENDRINAGVPVVSVDGVINTLVMDEIVEQVSRLRSILHFAQ